MDDFWPRGYRSAAEYCFDEEQADAIVRTTAYHRRDYCLSVIWFSPREHIDIRPSIATPFPRAASAGIGSLDRLPLELLFDTLYRLDMHSLFKFRQINLRARLLVDSLTEYQKVVSYGLNLFCALLRTRLITKVSLLDIYKALCTKTCRFCGQFGGFMSLIIWRRCCFRCLQWSRDTQVRTLASVRKYLRMTKYEGDRLRSFKSLPGIYSMNETVQKSRIRLVSLDQAIFTPYRLHRHIPTLDPAEGSDRIQKINFMGSCALPYYDKETDKVERGISCAGCQLSIEKGITGTPDTIWGYDARDKVYAQDSFLEHFRWCEQAQLLWRSSNEGRDQPPELPVSARTGGYFQRRE